jgi:hypothetical protein
VARKDCDRKKRGKAGIINPGLFSLGFNPGTENLDFKHIFMEIAHAYYKLCIFTKIQVKLSCAKNPIDFPNFVKWSSGIRVLESPEVAKRGNTFPGSVLTKLGYCGGPDGEAVCF